MNTAAYLYQDNLDQARLNIGASIAQESARIYAELTDKELGISQVLDALAAEDWRGLEAMALDAGIIRRLEDEIPVAAACELFGKNCKHLGYGPRRFWFAIDEMASRMAYQRAEKMARRLGF